MLSIVLVEPQIPQNTGNIGRLCACTGARLFLVGKLGFDTDEKACRRAGLDYWGSLDVKYPASLEELWAEHPDSRFLYFSARAERLYTTIQYDPDDFLVFGRETEGLPKELVQENGERSMRIPMSSEYDHRSLNLAHAAGIVLYEAIRQCDLLG